MPDYEADVGQSDEAEARPIQEAEADGIGEAEAGEGEADGIPEAEADEAADGIGEAEAGEAGADGIRAGETDGVRETDARRAHDPATTRNQVTKTERTDQRHPVETDRIAAIWRRRYRILGAAIAVAIVTFAACEILPKTYSSSATISVSLPPQEQAAISGQGATAASSLASQYAQTATLGPVLAAAAPKSGTTASQLTNSVSAGTISGENLIAVRAEAPSPAAAALRANAVASALVANITASNSKQVSAYSHSVERALVPETAQINSLQAKIAHGHLRPAAMAADESELANLVLQRSQVSSVVVQNAATEPTVAVLAQAGSGTQVQPRTVLYTLVAFLVALLASGQIAVLIESYRRDAHS